MLGPSLTHPGDALPQSTVYPAAMNSPSNPSPELVLLDQLIQDFQGVLLSLDAACQPLQPGEPVRVAIEASLDHADRVLEKWRDRVRLTEGASRPRGSGDLA
jgi:hypothetical protein